MNDEIRITWAGVPSCYEHGYRQIHLFKRSLRVINERYPEASDDLRWEASSVITNIFGPYRNHNFLCWYEKYLENPQMVRDHWKERIEARSKQGFPC